VFSYITFQHIPKAAITLNYIREAGRVLKAGGHFYFQVNNMPVGLRDRLRLRSRMRAVLKRPEASSGSPGGPAGLDHPAWQGSRVSVRRIEAACRSAGLRVMSLDGRGTQYLWVKAAKP
jgi:hypothetical protein